MQPNQRSAYPKNNSLDDAFKSLEQLLHVLQGAEASPGQPDAEQAGETGGNDSPARRRLRTPASATAAPCTPAPGASPSAPSTGGTDLDDLRTPPPQVGVGWRAARPRQLSDTGELLQAAERGFLTPRSNTDLHTSVTPLAWHAEAPGVAAPPTSMRSVREDLDTTQQGELGHAEVLATLRHRETELAEVKALWLQESSRLRRRVEQQEQELAELRAEQEEDGLGPLPVFPASAKAAGRREASAQCDTTTEPLRSCAEELCRMRALVQASAEELSALKHQHEEELLQMRALLGMREEELAALKAEHFEQASPVERRQSMLQVSLRDKEEEALKLTSELQSTNFKLNRLQSQQEKELEDCSEFLKRLAVSSSTAALGLSFDLGTAEVLGMGNYGYIITCRSKKSGDRVVVKLQSVRWAGVAVKEWAHGSQLSGHSHIVSYIEAIMHRDANGEIENHLKAGFDKGILTRRRPKFFPDCYFCLALEFMDRGTVQNFMDRYTLSPESIGAITRQVASALAFMHKRKRTHNDIKPENILLREDPSGDCLVAKLADLGLADHSSERTRDQELFGYTVWCMGVRERFERCPTSQGERDASVKQFRQAAPSQKPSREIWEVLAKIVAEMWQGSGEMVEVESAQRLQGLKITLPVSREEAVDLEASAKLDLQRRTTIGWRTHQWRHRGSKSFLQLMSIHVDENGCKIADSEPEEEREGSDDDEQAGALMAATWPPSRR